MGGTVQVMKKNIYAPRPDHAGINSFPSGHTATDFTGVGIGILSAEAGYLLLPVFRKLTGAKENRNLLVTPVIQARGPGMGMAYTF